MTTYIQSRAYRAPEVIVGAHYGTKIDIWSLGCVLFELETGSVLFPAENLHEALFKVVKILNQVPPEGSNTSTYFNSDGSVRGYEDTSATNLTNLDALGDELFRGFVKSLLCVNPIDRPSASEALSHPWLH